MDANEFDVLDFNGVREWIAYGVQQGWISEPVCYHHDTLPTTDIEAEEMDEGDDPCINIIRIWSP